MTTKYFCDRCNQEKDIWTIEINLQGREFKSELCRECIDELKGVLKVFFDIESLSSLENKI